MANFSQVVFGTPGQATPLPTYDPMRQEVFNSLLQQGQQNYNPQAMEDLAYRNFHTKIVPGLKEQFAAGFAGGPRSGGFGAALSSAGANLEANLAAQRSNMGLQQLKLGLTPQFEYLYQPEKKGLVTQGVESFVTEGAKALPTLTQRALESIFKTPSPQEQPNQPVEAPKYGLTPAAYSEPFNPKLQQQALKPGEQEQASYKSGAYVPATLPGQVGEALASQAVQTGAQAATATAAKLLGMTVPQALVIGAAVVGAGYGAKKLYDYLTRKK